MTSLFRKFLAASAAALMLAMPMTTHASAGRFSDVKPTAWYHQAVDYATDEGLFNGTSGNTFSPDGNMTRGMFVTVLANKTSGYKAVRYGATSFTDVPVGQWYAAPVE